MAQILASRLWEERRLAYPINGQRKGTYWLTYFRLDSGQLEALRRDCQINESILRELILKVDPRIIDALVAHTQTATDAAKARRATAARLPWRPWPKNRSAGPGQRTRISGATTVAVMLFAVPQHAVGSPRRADRRPVTCTRPGYNLRRSPL